MASIHRLMIDQQLAELGLKVTPAKMKIDFPRMQMKITSEHAKMEIDSKAPSFRINRNKINNESGLKAPSVFTKDFRDAGLAGALRSVNTASKDGNFVGDLRIRGNRIAKLARNKSMAAALKKKQLDLRLMPQNSPEVKWDKGYMHINWSKHSIVIDWDGEYLPQLTIDPKYSVEIFMLKEPYFKVNVEKMETPNSVGRYVDRAI